MLIIIVILFNIVINVDALKCYSCTYAGGTVDDRCVTNPESEEENYVIECSKTYCLSVRVEDKNDNNRVISMARYCDDTFLYKNKIEENSLTRSYHKVCQTDLCNGGTGRELTVNQRDRDDGEPIVLLVPGTGAGNTVYLYSSLIFISIFSCFYSKLLVLLV